MGHRLAIAWVFALALVGCASTADIAMKLSPGMSNVEIVEVVGAPYERTFRGTDEAWRYQEVVGFGQCR